MHIGKLTCTALAGFILSVAAGRASANTVTAHLDSITNYSTVGISLDGHATKSTAYAGPLNWTRSGGDYAGLGGESSATQFTTFCVEITQEVSLNHTYTYNVVGVEQAPDPGGSGVGSGMGLTKAMEIQELWRQHRADVVDNVSGAAFQLAVWEIVYDDGNLLNSGSFQAWNPLDAVPVKAQSWLDSLQQSSDLPLLGGLSAAGIQDQIFFIADPPIHETTVPVPAAAWSGALLLGALGVNRIRRRLSAE